MRKNRVWRYCTCSEHRTADTSDMRTERKRREKRLKLRIRIDWN